MATQQQCVTVSKGEVLYIHPIHPVSACGQMPMFISDQDIAVGLFEGSYVITTKPFLEVEAIWDKNRAQAASIVRNHNTI